MSGYATFLVKNGPSPWNYWAFAKAGKKVGVTFIGTTSIPGGLTFANFKAGYVPLVQGNIQRQFQHFAGSSHLTGTIQVGVLGVSRRVRLYDAETGVLLEERWSASDGTVTFPYVASDMEFTIVSVDNDNKQYNDVVWARVKAVP